MPSYLMAVVVVHSFARSMTHTISSSSFGSEDGRDKDVSSSSSVLDKDGGPGKGVGVEVEEDDGERLLLVVEEEQFPMMRH